MRAPAGVRAGLVRAGLVGAASGARSQIGTAAVAVSGRAETAPEPLDLLAGRPAVIGTVTAAVGELIADKLPATPSRLTAAGLVPRVVLGGLAAAVLAADAVRVLAPPPRPAARGGRRERFGAAGGFGELGVGVGGFGVGGSGVGVSGVGFDGFGGEARALLTRAGPARHRRRGRRGRGGRRRLRGRPLAPPVVPARTRRLARRGPGGPSRPGPRGRRVHQSDSPTPYR